MEPIGEMSSVDTSEIPIDVAGKLDIPIATKKKLRFTPHRKSRDKPVSEKTDFQSFLHPEPVHNVFTLRLNDAGELVGFNLKKSTLSKEKICLWTIF